MKSIILFIALSCLTPFASADDLPDVPIELQKLIDEGNSKALVKLGYLYFTGKGVEKDLNKARHLYEKAADKGDLWAMNNLCNIYLYGEGVPKDLTLAFQYCSEPARAGNSSAMVMLAEIASAENGPYKENIGFGKELSFKFYEMAAKREHPHGQYMLGIYYENGIVVTKDFIAATNWYRKAANQNYEKAAIALSRLNK